MGEDQDFDSEDFDLDTGEIIKNTSTAIYFEFDGSYSFFSFSKSR